VTGPSPPPVENEIERNPGAIQRAGSESFGCWIYIVLAMSALIACGERETAMERDPQSGHATLPREAEGFAAMPPEPASADKEAANPGASPPAEHEDQSETSAPRFPRGLVTHKPGVTPGYVLFNPLLSETTYLMNNDGAVVHTWKTAHSPGGGIYLLPNGNLLRPARDHENLGFPVGGVAGILQKIDWEGNVVWEWRLSDKKYVQHHDIEPLPNGNLLLIAWEVKSKEEALRAGRREDQIPVRGLWPDWLLEIEPIRPGGANVVWEWHSWDHLIQNHDAGAANYGELANHPERIDINAGTGELHVDANELAQLQALGYVPEEATPEDLGSDFLHVNSVDYHPRLDQIALSVPEFGEVWIIDHATTTEEARGPRGDLLYRWGNPSNYGRGDAAAMRLFYQHDARWIPDGWEGEGNLTVFNNGEDRPTGSFSSIDEWTPPLDETGRYAIGDSAPFGPAELTWQYVAEEPSEFFSSFISGVHRTVNGNTMICSGVKGRFFEVTRSGEIVWEFLNPFSDDALNADDSPALPGLEDSPYAAFRAMRIAADHPGLANRELAALDPQPAWYDYTAREKDAPKNPDPPGQSDDG
jgi:hypothetical protein